MSSPTPTEILEDRGDAPEAAIPLDLSEELLNAYDSLLSSLNELCSEGYWNGQLSTSALSTATAISAMTQVLEARRRGELDTPSSKDPTLSASDFPDDVLSSAIAGGNQWLAEHQNEDGGFGDTDRSHSNIATTFLVIAAWEMSGFGKQVDEQLSRAWEYVEKGGMWDGLRARYGKDKTFVVPILANCALAGLVPWKKVPALPFEAAWLPQDYYRLARMPVVSYAVPALVAIGQARFHFAPTANPVLAAVRRRARVPTLKVLRKMQPESGGYLEAVPLTSFVLMSLASIGQSRLPVAQEALRFILESRLDDGSWPIDTNLATWVTSLSLHSLSQRTGALSLSKNQEPEVLYQDDRSVAHPSIEQCTLQWLLNCQHKQRHPFTGAEPGGWGWTDLSGAVPDADDTPGALLALSKIILDGDALHRPRAEVLVAAGNGLRWLSRLQNGDGGWPTFCRGWGKLPFDRSGTDLTAHAIRAIHAWLPRLEDLQALTPKTPSRAKLSRQMKRGFRFLARTQAEDGSWLPLWFGNQDRCEEDNPIYGTSKVLLAYAATGQLTTPQATLGIQYLLSSQNEDGGWGGGKSTSYRNSPSHEGFAASTIEETALALETLLTSGGQGAGQATIMRGLHWLCWAIREDHHRTAWPIGFYFAKLWYYERLYPIVFFIGRDRQSNRFAGRVGGT